MQGTVLLVDDEQNLTMFLAKILESEGFDVYTALDGASAREKASQVYPEVMVLDIRLPDIDGVDLMKELRASYPHAQYVMMTAHGTIRTAVESTRLGAFEYLTKPVGPDELISVLRRAMEKRRITEEVEQLRRKDWALPGGKDGRFEHFPSPAMRRVVDTALRAARSDATVLLTGESGTGKNYLARWIHDRSARSDGPFFDINCASISPTLVESELFGYEPGAFTGSRGRKRGLLELANGGTLLLDEIGDMDTSLQAKLLAFLDTHSIRRLGGEKSFRVNARIIAATNRRLEQLVQDGAFREDLFYRINVLTIEVPPLRDRRSDIMLLAQAILGQLAHEMDLKTVPPLGPNAIEQLEEYQWPGNVRELKNALERTLLENMDGENIPHVSIGKAAAISSQRPCPDGVFSVEFPDGGIDLKGTVRDMTRRLVLEALKRSETRTSACRLLGISRHSLTHYLKSLSLDE